MHDTCDGAFQFAATFCGFKRSCLLSKTCTPSQVDSGIDFLKVQHQTRIQLQVILRIVLAARQPGA